MERLFTYNVKNKVVKFTLMLLFALLLATTSCLKEKAYDPPTDNEVGQTAIIPMQPEYLNQFYYSLADNKIVSTNPRAAFHLMFDCSANSFNIWLNTSMFMSVMETSKTSFSDVNLEDSVGGEWRYEFGAFNVDSNAIGQWWISNNGNPVSKNKVYILSLGVNNDGEMLGFVKLRINDFSNNAYSVTYQNFGSSDSTTFVLTKDASSSYRYLSFTNNIGIVDGIEPPKADWDVCFTRYTVGFYNVFGVSFLPYLVTGVLNNPAHTTVYMDSTITFDSITIADFDFGRLQSRRDAIGFEWKRYSGFSETGTYSMNPQYIYYIKAGEDTYYKLRFLEFSKDGVRGYPTFEYYKL